MALYEACPAGFGRLVAPHALMAWRLLRRSHQHIQQRLLWDWEGRPPIIGCERRVTRPAASVGLEHRAKEVQRCEGLNGELVWREHSAGCDWRPSWSCCWARWPVVLAPRRSHPGRA